MVYWWQRIIAVVAAFVTDVFVVYFAAPQLFIGFGESWLVWTFEISVLIGVYILVTKLFKYRNKLNNARDWENQNSELIATSSGEVYKASETALVFNTVSDLVNKEDIANLHYTTLVVTGHLISEGRRYYIIEKNDNGEIARIEALFDAVVPTVVDNKPHYYEGTLIVETGRTFLQWTKLCQY